MNNPFEAIDNRLSKIENLILDLKQTFKPIEKSNQSEELLTISETAKFLSLTVATIYSKVSRKELPYMKRGKRLYFSRQELIEYLKQGRIKTNSEINKEAEDYLKSKKSVGL